MIAVPLSSYDLLNPILMNSLCFKFDRGNGMDLSIGIEESKVAVALFMNNRFDEARGLMTPWYVHFKFFLCTCTSNSQLT